MKTIHESADRRSRKVAVGLFGAALLIAAQLTVSAEPASAAVPGLVRVSEVSLENSDSPKVVTAECPPYKRLVGTGYEVSGATGEVSVSGLVPNGDSITAPNAVSATAYELDPFGGSWKVRVYAMCADSLPGLVRIEAWSTPFSNDRDEVTATCPDDKQLVGTGFYVDGRGEVVVDEVLPNGSTTTAPTSVTVEAYEADGTNESWSPLIAHAICADPVPGLVRVQSGGATNSDDSNTSSRTCPSDKVLTGAGFQFAGSFGEVVVDDFEPNGSSTSAPNSITVAGYETDPFYEVWAVQTFGICADR